MQQQWLGLTDYERACDLQKQLSEQVRAGSEGILLGLQHPSVITLGKRGKLSEDVLPACPLPILQADRGGQATLHQPGQLVIYPILDLAKMNLSVRRYVCLLETALMQTLAEMQIHAFRGPQAGIFTEQGKIGFVGVRIDRGVSRHGLSLNVSNDLTQFQFIRSCGLTQAKVTRTDDFAQATRNLTVEELFYKWCEHFLTITHDLVNSCPSKQSHPSSLGVVGSASP